MVRGTVIDFELNRLKNVTITNLNTKTSSATDEEGKFTILANLRDSVKFFYIGLKPEFVVVKGDDENLNLILVEDNYDCFESDSHYARDQRRLKRRMDKLYSKADKKNVFENKL